MSFELKTVVPWGRSYNEYLAMFSLTKNDLNKKILGCADGPASFNAELTKRGGNVISIDPIYQFSSKEIKSRIDTTYAEVIEQTLQNRNEFSWQNIKTPDELGRIRMKAMKSFLKDYAKNKNYIAGALPFLPFQNNEFELTLCSHFLFLYSKQFSLEFHIKSIKELLRISNEVRIFPLLELGSIKSRHLDNILLELNKEKWDWTIEKVPYEFQKGGDEMLKIKY